MAFPQHCEIIIGTATQDKALRGTKRLCLACEVPFYDLSRDPIVCPSCGALYTPVARTITEIVAGATSLVDKTGRRSTRFKHPVPTLPASEEGRSSESVADENATEDVAGRVPDDDLVLEHEPDDADVSELVDPTVADPKEQ